MKNVSPCKANLSPGLVSQRRSKVLWSSRGKTRDNCGESRLNELRGHTSVMTAPEMLLAGAVEAVTGCWGCAAEISCQAVIGLAAYVGVCVFLYRLLVRPSHQLAWQLPGPPSRLLLLTAHPDDEVMFFGPMLYWLTRPESNSQVHLLCMSMGGDVQRKDELWACAKRLGIPEANVTIMMCTELPDDPTLQWPEEIVTEVVLQYIESCKIDALVTFDKHGVSKHKNHISLYYAIASLCIEKKIPSYCKFYTLESVNIFRKYTQLLDLPISLLSASYWYLITYNQRNYIQHAMMAHKSQYVWFRKLYMMFSRYTLLNTLHEVNILDIELDLQLDDDD